jgi:fumarate hydratase class I
MDYIKRAGRRLRGGTGSGGQGRDRADPHQLPDVRRGASPDLPGHRHRGVFLKVGMDVRWDATMSCRRWSTRACAAPTCTPRTCCARRSSAIPAFTRKNTKDNTPACRPLRDRAGRHRRGEARGQGWWLGEQDEVRDAQPERQHRRLGAQDRAARWAPAGARRACSGIGIGGTAEKAMLMAKESADGAHRHGQLKARGPQNRIEELRIEITTRSTRWASARRGWAGSPRCST